MKLLHLTGSVFFLAVQFFLFSDQVLAREPVIDKQYTLVKKVKISRTEYDFSYNVKLLNGDFAIKNASASVSSNSIHTSVLDGSVAFNDLAAESVATSIDSFTIRQDRRFIFDPASLVWKLKYDPTVSTSSFKVISPDGGELTLGGVGTVTFPKGSFNFDQEVELSTTTTAEAAADFALTAEMFSAGIRVPYEVRINAGKTQPTGSIVAKLDLPASFLTQVPKNSEIQVFAQIFQDGGEEILDSFELLPSDISVVNSKVTVTLPPETFTNRRNLDETFEAIIIISTTPTKQNSAASPLTRQNILTLVEKPLQSPLDAIINLPNPFVKSNSLIQAAVTAKCEGATLGSPVDNPTVTGKFNGKNHFGTDFRAANGTKVFAASDGVIEKIGFDERPLTRPDPRSGKLIKGWGTYVVLKHTDGSKSLYAHLESSSLKAGSTVNKGDTIALSDNSGGSSGPHLHFEYAPNGKIYDKASKIDPDPCIDQNVSGSITVNDNGLLADDAFRVSINGLLVCTTSIGASNTCAVGNLRKGTATLSIIAVVAPDDVGTYEVTLAEGLTFSDASTSRSGTLPQGGSATFNIIIP